MVARHVDAGAAANAQSAPAGQAGSLLNSIEPVLDAETVQRFQADRMRVAIAPVLHEYLVDIVHATRAHVSVALGASPRATLALQRAAQAHALLDGRTFIVPDDIKQLAPHVLPHRLILHGESGDGRAGAELVRAVLDEVPVP